MVQTDDVSFRISSTNHKEAACSNDEQEKPTQKVSGHINEGCSHQSGQKWSESFGQVVCCRQCSRFGSTDTNYAHYHDVSTEIDPPAATGSHGPGYHSYDVLRVLLQAIHVTQSDLPAREEQEKGAIDLDERGAVDSRGKLTRDDRLCPTCANLSVSVIVRVG